MGSVHIGMIATKTEFENLHSLDESRLTFAAINIQVSLLEPPFSLVAWRGITHWDIFEFWAQY